MAEIFAPIAKRPRAPGLDRLGKRRAVSTDPPVLTPAGARARPNGARSRTEPEPAAGRASPGQRIGGDHRRHEPSRRAERRRSARRTSTSGRAGVRPRRASRRAVRELLLAVGEDPEREGLRETPARVARAYAELFAGLRQSPQDVLTTTFDVGHDEMVLVKRHRAVSTCEHHLVPFHGVAHVGYIPAATAGSPACPSWPGWSTCTPGARRCRSG